MFGITYGQLFLIIGATAALVGRKDLPIIARTAGRLAGRAIGYVQLARGQFDSLMQQSQASQVHKELQDAMQQLEAIRHEIRSVSVMYPGPMTRKLMDFPPQPAVDLDDDSSLGKPQEASKPADPVLKDLSQDHKFNPSGSVTIHSQATAYSKFAESEAVKSASLESFVDGGNFNNEEGLLTVLPLSAESAGMLPKRKENAKGSDILLEAVIEAEVAHKAKEFFSQPQNHIQ